MNNRQIQTRKRIFADPVSASIDWADIDSLLIAVGCRVIEGRGSRVRFVYKSVVITLHRPHPEKEAKKYQVREVREFLSKIGNLR